MMHYRKGDNVEEELTKEKLPFENLTNDFLWMQVKGGTKVSNVVDFAKKSLDTAKYRTMVWSGYGGGIVKTISCVEILKRSYPLHQITRLTYKTIDEHWLPQMEGLEEIVAKRQIPCIHILLTLDDINEKMPGLQKTGTKTPFWIERPGRENQPSGSGRNRNDQGKQRFQKKNQNRQNNTNRPPPHQKQQQHQRKEKKTKPETAEPMES